MGQYYTPIILSEDGSEPIAAFDAYEFHNGYKLMEHSYIGNGFVDAVVSEMVNAGKPVTVVWKGDYGEEEDLKGGEARDWARLFKAAKDVELSETMARKRPDDVKSSDAAANVVFYNLTTHQKLDLAKYRAHVIEMREKVGYEGRRHGGCGMEDLLIHPLPLLTALGNGKGGGDYFAGGPDEGWVGVWALCSIIAQKAEDRQPEGEFRDISSSFWFEEL